MNYCGKGELESYIFFNIYFEVERRDAMEPTTGDFNLMFVLNRGISFT